MYDDTTRHDEQNTPPRPSWREYAAAWTPRWDDRVPDVPEEPDDPGELVHLCPECRELMSDVLHQLRRLEAVPAVPPEPAWSTARRWLASLCGGPDAVDALDASPLGEAPDLPEPDDTAARQRLAATARLLDDLAERVFVDEEVAVAFRRALLLVWERRPEIVRGARSAALLASGVCWAVGRANGLLWPAGQVRDKDVRAVLATTQSGSSYGSKVRSALTGPYAWQAAARPYGYDGYHRAESRELLPLGHPSLLLGRTRARLVEVRARAEAERARAAA